MLQIIVVCIKAIEQIFTLFKKLSKSSKLIGSKTPPPPFYKCIKAMYNVTNQRLHCIKYCVHIIKSTFDQFSSL